MATPELTKHVVIVGHGRSGTNMVLDLFDNHPNTFCRNEPNALAGTVFTGLGDRMFPDVRPNDFETNWRQAISQTIRAAGARDRFPTNKHYFRSGLHARLGQSLMSRQKFRACILPRSEGVVLEEWPCPGLYYNLDAQARALPVLKILLAPAWIVRAHDMIPAQHVVHVLRHPQGFVQSWWNRYVSGIGGSPEKVFADNKPSLIRILRHFGRTDEMPTQYSLDALVTSELWRWRYMNEAFLEQLSGSARYITLTYESVMQDKLQWAEHIYSFAGLEMTSHCQQSIQTMQNTLFGIKKPDVLDPELVRDAIEEVVSDSPWRTRLLGNVTPAV